MSKAAQHTEVLIVVESLDPLSGHGSLPGQDHWRFTGWLELIENVERLKARHVQQQDELRDSETVER